MLITEIWELDLIRKSYKGKIACVSLIGRKKRYSVYKVFDIFNNVTLAFVYPDKVKFIEK